MNRANVVLPDKLGRDIQSGQLAYWDGTQFQPLPDEDGDNLVTTMKCLVQQIATLRCEVQALRLGMVETGMCAKFDPSQLNSENI